MISTGIGLSMLLRAPRQNIYSYRDPFPFPSTCQTESSRGGRAKGKPLRAREGEEGIRGKQRPDSVFPISMKVGFPFSLFPTAGQDVCKWKTLLLSEPNKKTQDTRQIFFHALLFTQMNKLCHWCWGI